MRKHSLLPAIAFVVTGLAVACGPTEQEKKETQTEAEEKVDAIIRDLENSAQDANSVADTLPADTAGAQNQTYTESRQETIED